MKLTRGWVALMKTGYNRPFKATGNIKPLSRETVMLDSISLPVALDE